MHLCGKFRRNARKNKSSNNMRTQSAYHGPLVRKYGRLRGGISRFYTTYIIIDIHDICTCENFFCTLHLIQTFRTFRYNRYDSAITTMIRLPCARNPLTQNGIVVSCSKPKRMKSKKNRSRYACWITRRTRHITQSAKFTSTSSRYSMWKDQRQSMVKKA